jgi:hypothetical protein
LSWPSLCVCVCVCVCVWLCILLYYFYRNTKCIACFPPAFIVGLLLHQ